MVGANQEFPLQGESWKRHHQQTLSTVMPSSVKGKLCSIHKQSLRLRVRLLGSVYPNMHKARGYGLLYFTHIFQLSLIKSDYVISNRSVLRKKTRNLYCA